jgi:primary-amine oxidase
MSTHPLDPLSAAELSAVVDGLRSSKGLDHRHLLSMVQLHEPTKSELDEWAAGRDLVRAAFVTVWNREAALISEAVVSVDGEVVDGRTGCAVARLSPGSQRRTRRGQG